TFREPDPARIFSERNAHLSRDVLRIGPTASTAGGTGLRANELLALTTVDVIDPELRIARGDDVLPVRRVVGRVVGVRLAAGDLVRVRLVDGNRPQVPSAIAVAHEHDLLPV